MFVKVLHCIHSLSSGGAERQVKLLAEISHQVGIESAIFCVNDRNTKLGDGSIPLYRSKCQGKYNLGVFGSILHSIEDFSPDVVHAWLPASITIPAMVASKLKGVPSVFSYRNAMRFHRPLTVPEYLTALFLSKRVTSNSSVEMSTLLYRYLYGLKRGVEIGNAVHVDKKYWKKDRAFAGKSRFKGIFVGRLTKQKNWQSLLRAFEYLDDKDKWELLLCGDGEDRAKVDRTIHDLGLEDQVKVLGYQDNVYPLMQQADVLILPSWYEGMPNVFLEALKIGLPTIVSDIAAHASIIGDSSCALKVPPDSPREIARALDRLVVNSDLVQDLVAAGSKVVEVHTLERMGAAYAAFYSSIS